MGAGDVKNTTVGDICGVSILMLRVPGRCRGRCALFSLLVIIVQGRLHSIVASIFEFDELVRELSD
jgi:hypothetical protein